jgi:DNA-binding response OmpR family regulator
VVQGKNRATLSILVVEHDVAVAELIRTILNQVPGWGATVVHDAAAAREVFRHVKVEALVIDVALPGITGLELMQLLQQDPLWAEPSVLLLLDAGDRAGIAGAVRDSPVTRILPKPFDVDDLVREVRAAVDAPHPHAPVSGAGVQVLGALTIDRSCCSVAVGGVLVNLTPTEYRLLCELADHPGRVVPSEELAERVWGYHDLGIRRSLGVHLRRLRAKLTAGPVRAPVPVAVRGLGYRLSSRARDGRAVTGDVAAH